MRDLAEQLRSYVDDVVDRLETNEAELPIEQRRRRSQALWLVAAAAAILLGIVGAYVALAPDDASHVATTPGRVSRSRSFTPNASVAKDVIAAQAQGATVVVPVVDHLYVSADRLGKWICFQVNEAGRGDGPMSCAMPASSPWPDGVIFASGVEVGGRQVIVGAVAARRVHSIGVTGREPEKVTDSHMPFPTLSFFLLRDTSGSVVTGFGRDGTRVGTAPVHDWNDQPSGIVVGGATADEISTALRVVDFARTRSDETFAAIPFATGQPIRLLRNGVPSAAAMPSELRDPSVWDVRDASGVDGRWQSALDAITSAGSAIGANLGPYSSCAASPERLPVAYDKDIVVEPTDVDSCADWFGIDVYLRDGRIVAINLQDPDR